MGFPCCRAERKPHGYGRRPRAKTKSGLTDCGLYGSIPARRRIHYNSSLPPTHFGVVTMPRRYCVCVLCAVAAAVAYLMMFGFSQSASAQQPGKPVSFINDVAPILKENCFACHDSKKRSGKYEMTTFEKTMAGGANGEPIVPGKPETSEFHNLIVSADQRRMPPRDKGEAVPREKAAVIAQWIKEGAKIDKGL